MNKELRIVLKRINLEQLNKENNSKNVCDQDRALLSGDEILLMNYDDIFAENTEITCFKSKDCGAKKRDTKLKYNAVQETVVSKTEIVEVEEDTLCDVDTKEDILKKFEKNAKEIEKEKNGKTEQSNSDGKHIICNECGFRAKKKPHLQTHIKLTHLRKKPIRPPTEVECQYCMFKSKYKTSLSLHMASFHMDKTQTDGSAETSAKKSCYEIQGTNVMDHCTLDKNGIYNCIYCSYTHSKKFPFQKHLVIHTVHKSKVLNCPHCPKKFTHQVLQAHIRKVHNSEGLENCPKCTYTSKCRSNIRRHIQQNKDRDECRRVHKRKRAEHMRQEPLEGKAT